LKISVFNVGRAKLLFERDIPLDGEHPGEVDEIGILTPAADKKKGFTLI
jgi:hypothetical protein